MANKTTIRGAEWLAENAFLTPGKHRLLTASGLAVGLYAGREIMDAVTARRALRDKPMDREDTLAFLRPVHGVMKYNPYSDGAADRWKQVADSFAPMVLGGLGAYIGSRHYFYAGKAVKALGKGAKLTLEAADDAANMAQSDSVSKLSSASFAAGSPFGTHLFGAFFPLNNGMSSVRFQLARRNPHVPFLDKFNKWMGNYGTSSHKLKESLGLSIKWMEETILVVAKGGKIDQVRLRKAAKDILQIFGDVPDSSVTRLMKHMEEIIEAVADATKHIKNPDERAAAAQALLRTGQQKNKNGDVVLSIAEELGSFSGVGLERLLIKADFAKQLANVKLGDNGPMTFFARMLGSAKGERKAEAAYRQHLMDTHGFTHDMFDKVTNVVIDRTKAAMAVGASAAMAGGALLAGAHTHDKAEQLQRTKDGTNSRADQAAHYHEQKDKQVGNAVDWANSKPLDVMHWLSRVVITPPSMHRLMNAAYFSLALIGGTKLGNVMAGRDLKSIFSTHNAGSVIEKSKVWGPFKHLHGVLSYTPGTGAPKDRIRQAAHFIMPVAVGMAGTFTGSHLFFRDRIKKLDQREYLEDYMDKASMEQSKVYAGATALTSIFNTGSGLHFLPVFSYSSNLHNRFMMAGGYQVAMPVLGKAWSGNPSLFPWAVSRTLDFTVKYLAHNAEEFPELLPALSHAIIAKMYPDLPEKELGAKERAFINRVYELRDPHLERGRIPAEKGKELEEMFRKELTKDGLERTLTAIGLDPTKAQLAANGASGKIADTLGVGGAVEKLHDEYAQKYQTRKLQPEPEVPNTQVSENRQNEGKLHKALQRFTEKPAKFIDRVRLAGGQGAAPQPFLE